MIEAELPDGTVLEFPDGTSPDVVQRVVKQRLGVASAQTNATPEQSSGFGQTLGNLAAGAARGAGSIGATLLAPVDAAARAMGVQNSVIGRTDRRDAMTEGLRSMGAQPESLAFRGAKVVSEVAGTAGAGGAMANALRVAPAAMQAAPAVQGFATALRSSGMAGPNLASRVAGGAATGAAASTLVDPESATTGAVIGGALPLIGPTASAIGTGVQKAIGSTTGVGDDALRQAYQSGKSGGAQAEALRSNMRGQADMLSVLDDAKANLEAMRQARSAAYKQNMAGVRESAEVIPMEPIENALSNAVQSFTFKGQAKNPRVAQALQSVSDEISQWRQLDPAEFHTPEGLDALKQRIGAVREALPFEDRSARAAVDGVYNSIKREIESKAPEYAKAMADYSEASSLVDEVTRSMSLNERSTADTALRKLQSVMRNNANTNYGARVNSVESLEAAGGRPLMPQLAGQALNDWVPRGIQRAAAGTGGAGLAFTGNVPAALGLAAVSSPRLMGETFYGAGRVAGVADQMVNPALIEALRQGTVRAAPVIGAQ